MVSKTDNFSAVFHELRSLDTETTGVDLRHSARPYIITTCALEQDPTFWEFDLNPLTRTPIVPEEFYDEFNRSMSGTCLVMQNGKFDLAVLDTLDNALILEWLTNDVWIFDTLFAAHLLQSNQPHDLTTLALVYLGINIQPYEDEVERATKEAQRLARSQYPEWAVAKKGRPDMPSAKEKVWKYDMWLPRALAQELNYPDDHPWWTAASKYACMDSLVTVNLLPVMFEKMQERNLLAIYYERLKLIPILFKMERYGVSASGKRMDETSDRLMEESLEANMICVNIAKEMGYDLQLPKSGVNNSLKHFCFGKTETFDDGSQSKETWLDLEVVRHTDNGEPSMDKHAMDIYMAKLPPRSKKLAFIKNLRSKRLRDTGINYIQSYEKFRVPHPSSPGGDWYNLYPSLNPTGTATLRFSSSNPNEQQISKKGEANLRYIFGPAPGREWWSCDAKNIELRLPVYEVQEEEIMAIFERPNDPPYYGSYHLLVFDILHPEKFAEHGAKVKDLYDDTWYQWTKNGNFAVQYGAVESSGTADLAYHVPGAQAKIQSRFRGIKQLNDRMIAMAEHCGYVETIPDKTVDPDRGYPLLCTRSKWGKILPTVPLNYHIQGTAMWWMMKAMIRCHAQLEVWSTKGFDGQIVMQVHDELVFDFPKSKMRNINGKKVPSNKWRIQRLMQLMEEGGNDIGIPTPVSCKYHPRTWSEGLSV